MRLKNHSRKIRAALCMTGDQRSQVHGASISLAHNEKTVSATEQTDRRSGSVEEEKRSVPNTSLTIANGLSKCCAN
jgi:hypothetical protein